MTFAQNCEICDELNYGSNNSFRILFSKEELNTRVIHETSNYMATPGIGALLSGYVLVWSKQHVMSLSYLSPEQLEELEHLVTILRNQIYKTTKIPTVVFEHGGTGSHIQLNEIRCGACIDHAHLHICPTLTDINTRFDVEKFKIHQIARLQDLANWQSKKTHYLFYENLAGEKIIYQPKESLPSQFMRRHWSENLGIPDKWDWALFPMKHHMISTIDMFRKNSHDIDVTANNKSIPPFDNSRNILSETIVSYNLIANDYFQRTKNLKDFPGVHADISNFVKIINGNLVLDAGTGTCRDTMFLIKNGFTVEAIDLSSDLLLTANIICPYPVKRLMDVTNLAYANDTFDGVWCNAVLLHLDDMLYKKALAEFWRILKSDGLLYISVKEGHGIEIAHTQNSSQHYRTFYLRSPEYVYNSLTAAGFELVNYCRRKETVKGATNDWITIFSQKKVS
ncbi:MAG: methyltransferase domain-containing protein [Deltaproteobacteria bacterium]|nr:methyltransferase domain-containing protein [Deltaproteobacteria bacterium]